MKFPIAQAGACLLFFQPFVSAMTYWVDASCRNTPQRQRAFDAALQQAIDLANRGFTRLGSNTDTDMKGVVDRVFNTNWANDQQTQNEILDFLGNGNNHQDGVSGWTAVPNNNRQASNVRIYCDNDNQNPQGGSRWTLQPDPPQWVGLPGYVANANRPRAFQPGALPPGAPGAPLYQWEDLDNGILTLSRGCQTPGTVIQGETYTVLNQNNPPAGNQPQMRSTVTLCDVQLNGALHSFGDIPLKKDIAGLVKPPAIPSGIDAFSSMTAFTLLHEFAHTNAFTKQDVDLPGGGRAYAWADIVNLAVADSRNNVNNYVFTAVLAVLADRHWRLSKVYNDWHNRGILVYDLHGITQKVKKWLKWEA